MSRSTTPSRSLAPYGIALRNGNSNHAPMVAEALCAMGRPDAVLPWIARYRERMLPRSGPGNRIRREDWREALGERDPVCRLECLLRRRIAGDALAGGARSLDGAPGAGLLRGGDAWRDPGRARCAKLGGERNAAAPP